MMTLIRPTISAIRLLEVTRDIGHLANTWHESSHNAILSDHNYEGGDGASGSTNPFDHGQCVGDACGSTPPHHSTDDHVPILEKVPHVFLERVDPPPYPSPDSSNVEEVLDHPSYSFTI